VQGKQAEMQQKNGSTDKNQFAAAAKALERKNTGEKSAAEQEADQNRNNSRNENGGKSQAEQQQPQTDGQSAHAESLSSEEQIAAEQWLRRIPDDPGGLLRRKFLYQYQQRAQREGTGSRQPW
jgi:Ca-activated chloride channel family protein